jgi:hypothetical protein
LILSPLRPLHPLAIAPLFIAECLPEADFGKLIDNSDHDAMDSWQPVTQTEAAAFATEQYTVRVAWLKYRCLQLRALRAMAGRETLACMEFCSKLTAAYQDGVVGVVEPSNETFCFKDGIHLPRRSQFATLLAVGATETFLTVPASMVRALAWFGWMWAGVCRDGRGLLLVKMVLQYQDRSLVSLDSLPLSILPC